ncbi:hypothetical protein J2808_000213 [Pseudarthrobacter sulfonivorans]|nr:hypothetical protein [Pseudarthrobacter sulfonivorans]
MAIALSWDWFGTQVDDFQIYLTAPARHELMVNAATFGNFLGRVVYSLLIAKTTSSPVRALAAVLICTAVLAELGEPTWLFLVGALALSVGVAVATALVERLGLSSTCALSCPRCRCGTIGRLLPRSTLILFQQDREKPTSNLSRRWLRRESSYLRVAYYVNLTQGTRSCRPIRRAWFLKLGGFKHFSPHSLGLSPKTAQKQRQRLDCSQSGKLPRSDFDAH